MAKQILLAVLGLMKVLIHMAAVIVNMGLPRYRGIRHFAESFLSTRAVRLTMFFIATAAILLEYLPERIPAITLVTLAVFLWIELRVGTLRPGMWWLAVMAIYELWIWGALLSVPILAFSGDTANAGRTIASLIHCIAFTYLLLDMAADDGTPRRRKRQRTEKRIWSRLGEGVFNPLPVQVPVVVAPNRF